MQYKNTKEEKRKQENKKKCQNLLKETRAEKNKLKTKVWRMQKKNQNKDKPKKPVYFFQFQLCRKFVLAKKAASMSALLTPFKLPIETVLVSDKLLVKVPSVT